MKKKKKLGAGGGGKFYRVEVRPEEKFVKYKLQGALERGRHDTLVWLVPKEDARLSKGRLVITEPKVRDAIERNIGGELLHVVGDIFQAHPAN